MKYYTWNVFSLCCSDITFIHTLQLMLKSMWLVGSRRDVNISLLRSWALFSWNDCISTMRLAVREAGLDTATDFLCSEKGRMVRWMMLQLYTASSLSAKSKCGTNSLLLYNSYIYIYIYIYLFIFIYKCWLQ